MLAGGSQKSQEHSSPIKTPIILAKHEKPGTSGEMRAAGRLWNPAETDGGVRLATSPKHGIPTLLQSGELPTTQPPAYKIQQRNDIKPLPGHDWTECTTQSAAVKIVDEYMTWCGESLAEFLLEQNDYRVIGVIGMEGVGKTHIMNLIATYPKKVDLPFKPDKTSSDSIHHSTTGLNAFVTADRIILLDCQPIFSSSVFESIISNERRYHTDYANSEDMYDAMNMELVMFMLSVCHIVIIAENWFTDPNLHRILQSVEMLKPPQLSSEKYGDHSEFTSKLVFVHNMCHAGDPDIYETGVMESSLTKIFSKSSLHIHRYHSNRNVKVVPLAWNKSSDDDENSSICKKFDQRFLQDIMAMRVTPILTHTTLSEKNWLQYASKMWEAVRKSPFLMEYMRLLSSV